MIKIMYEIGDKVIINGTKYKIINKKFNTTYNQYVYKLHSLDKRSEVLYGVSEEWFDEKIGG